MGGPVPVGSCKYDIQQLLDLAKLHIKEDCFKYFPINGCQLPIAAGHYGTANPLKIQLPEHFKIPSMVKEFMNGGIKIHESVIVYGSEAICINTKIYLDFK